MPIVIHAYPYLNLLPIWSDINQVPIAPFPKSYQIKK
jgi:hypothetical protein